MKKKLKQLKRLNKYIRECENEAATIRSLPYYRIFSQGAQQKADLYAVQMRLEGWLREKEELLLSLHSHCQFSVVAAVTSSAVEMNNVRLRTSNNFKP